jgi:hypothetical protein
MEGTELMKDFSDIRIFLCTTPIRINYSFDGLMGRAQSIFDQDPTSGHLFLFFNRSRDRPSKNDSLSARFFSKCSGWRRF